MAYLILVIEDEPDAAAAIVRALEHGGYRAITAADAAEGLERVRSERPDLILLDLVLGDRDGMEVCSEIREHSEVPIVMLTARTAEDDRVEGLTRGADDYVTKPFLAKELCARVAAVLRRSRHWSDDQEDVTVVGELCVNRPAREVTLRGEIVQLTPKEFDLLEYLARAVGEVVARERLLEHIWGEDEYIDPRTLDVHVRWLREKIEEDPSDPKYLLTVRGEGYELTEGM